MHAGTTSLEEPPVHAPHPDAGAAAVVPAAAARLQPGARLLAFAGHPPLQDAIECSAGIVPAAVLNPRLPHGMSYLDPAFLPAPPWRPPSAEEYRLLTTDRREVEYGNWLQLFRAPDDIYAEFEWLRRRAETASRETDLDALGNMPEFKASVTRGLEWAATLLLPTTTLIGGNAYFNEPGLPTTSNHKGNRLQLLGLHTDTICNVPVRDRRFSPNRVCINLGVCDRFLLYVNLALETIDALLAEARIEIDQSGRPLEKFRNAFMSRWTGYPVIKVRMRPGDAYIAPTDNLIHDGCSDGQNGFDLAFMAFGHFRPVW